MTKDIDSLVADMQALFTEGAHECDEGRVKAFGEALSQTVAKRLKEDRKNDGPGFLRMSNLGKPDRQLWYTIHSKDTGEELSASTRIKFLFGDILEELLLFLAEEAGHEVTHKQERVEVDGIKGSMDAVIDGVLVDVKSASTYAFQKFKRGTLKDDDPFGYMEQIAGYSEGLGKLPGAFLAIDKQLGHLALHQVPREELDAIDIRSRIRHVKEVVANEEMPPRCFEPIPEGTSGNLKLGVNCSYCAFKKDCWKDSNGGVGLRTFIYSKGPVHFTEVVREPNGPLETTF